MAFVTRKIVRGEGGRPQVIFINPQTGEQVPFEEVGNYQMIEQGTNIDFLDRTKSEEKTQTEEVLEEEVDPALWQGNDGSVDGGMGDIGDRNISSNFGYMSKPEALSLLSIVPGVGGLIGKGLNATINLNNTAAVNSARGFLGLEPMSPVDIAKGVAMGNKGYIGDIVVGDEQYAVGFEAKTEDGRTTLTPSEANARATKAALQGLETREATKDEVQSAIDKHVEDFGKEKSPGLLGPVQDAVRSVTDPLGDMVRSVTDPIGKAITGKEQAKGPIAQYAPTTGRTTPTAQPGRGLASLAPNGLTGGVGRTTNFGPQTVGPAQEDLSKAVELATENVFGPGYTVNQTSGARTNSQNHMGGRAVDFNVTDPNGNRVTDQGKLQEFGAELGRQGIQSLGYGKGYMGPGMMHAGLAPSPLGATSWGAGGKQVNADPGVRDAFQSELTPGVGVLPFQGMPVPTPNPAQPVDIPMGYAGQNRPTAAQTAIENMITTPVGNEGRQGKGIPQEVLNQMALTIAGELGSDTIQGILSGDPKRIQVAKAEVADIASTMKNRQMASQTGSWDHVVDPRQYNSRMGSNMPTTNRNYGQLSQFLNQTLGEFNSDRLVGNAPNATHYRAGYVNPDWANYATNEVRTGEHIFSNVNQKGTGRQEYLPVPPSRGPIPDSRPGAGLGYVGSSGYGEAGGSSPGFGGSDGGYGGSGGGGQGGTSGSSGQGGPGGTGGTSGGGGYSGGGSGSSGGNAGSGSSGGNSGNSGGSGNSVGQGMAGGGAFGDSIGAGGSGGSSIGNGIGVGSTGSGGSGGLSSGIGSGNQAGFGGNTGGNLGGSGSGMGSGLGAVGSSGTQSGFSGTGMAGGQGNNNQGGFSVSISGPTSGSNSGSGSGGDGDKVICGYFYGKGKIPKGIYLGDLKYSRDRAHKRTKSGYLAWAVPLVLWLEQKHTRPVIDKILFPFTKGWVYEMAWRVGYTKKRPLWGRIITPVISSVCYMIGYIKEIKEKT